MSATIQVKFGTLALDSTNNITCRPPTEKNSKPVQTVNIPCTDGAIAEEAKLGPKTITIEGDIAGSDYDDLRTNLGALKAGLLGQGIAKLTIDNERYINCQCKDFSYAYDHMTRRATWSATFIAHYPFWQAETATEDEDTPTSGVGYTVTNAGNAPARCKIEILADAETADSCKIQNTTTGKTFQYRGTIAAADVLEVDNRYDTDDFEVLNDGADDMDNYEGDFITLDPGENTIVYTGVAGPTITITHRATYY